MREYIFYVLLVFLPIGAFMVRILYNQGLPTKNIALIVLTSLGIVVTFPISMERLGVFLAFTTYAIILFLVILYMVKVEDNICLETSNNSTAPPKIPKIEDNDLSMVQDNANVNGFLEIMATNLIENQVAISVKDKNISLNTSVETIKYNDGTKNDDFAQLNNDSLELLEDIKEINLEHLNQEIDTNIEIISEEFVTEVKVDDMVPINEDIKNEMVEASSRVEEVMEEEGIDTVYTEVENTPQDLQLENESDDIAAYIESAFQYKIAGNNDKAIEQFLLIWENSKDNELKYLVTLELIEMYKMAGLYTLAQELLTKYYNDVKGLNNNIASEINRELTFMTLLLDEISRLGLEKVPLAELPRWVKIKVAEELNQLH